METKEAIRAVIEQDGLESAVEWIAGVVDEKHSRIEKLEAALKLYAGLERDGIKWEPLNDNGGVARAALGEKKDD